MLTLKEFSGFEMNRDQYFLREPFKIVNEEGEEVEAIEAADYLEAMGNYLLEKAEKQRQRMREIEKHPNPVRDLSGRIIGYGLTKKEQASLDADIASGKVILKKELEPLYMQEAMKKNHESA